MSAAVGLFAKPLIPGTVKTRLCPPLTPEQACDLYRAFLVDTASICSADPAWEFTVFSPDPAAQEASWPEEAHRPARFLLQQGNDLGERLHHAFEDLLGAGHIPAILVGSDHPTLPSTRLRDAVHVLQWGDVVLGPSLDGGYYLIGMNENPPPGLLGGIPWSTSSVFRATLDRVQAQGLRPRLLLPWYDVDTPEDLEFLRHEFQAEGASLSKSRATARALELLTPGQG